MSYISIVEYASASPEAKEQYDDQIKKHGRITNMKKTLLHSVPAFKALMQWYELRDEALNFLSEREVNFYSYAISLQNDCVICSTFFKKILVDQNINFDTFEFTDNENLLIEYGRALVRNQHNVDKKLFAKLSAQYTEEQVVLLTAFGGLMIATNLINSALNVPLDDYLLGY